MFEANHHCHICLFCAVNAVFTSITIKDCMPTHCHLSSWTTSMRCTRWRPCLLYYCTLWLPKYMHGRHHKSVCWAKPCTICQALLLSNSTAVSTSGSQVHIAAVTPSWHPSGGSRGKCFFPSYHGNGEAQYEKAARRHQNNVDDIHHCQCYKNQPTDGRTTQTQFRALNCCCSKITWR